MDTTELKVGQQIEIFYYENKSWGKAEISTIYKISTTGQITLEDGRRYTSKGIEIGAVYPGHLVSVDRANEVIERQKQIKLNRQAILESPEQKRKTLALKAAQASIDILNQNNYYADVDGEMHVMESEIKQILENYLEKHKKN